MLQTVRVHQKSQTINVQVPSESVVGVCEAAV